jgi:cell wall-associated NlpC family hydrolase
MMVAVIHRLRALLSAGGRSSTWGDQLAGVCSATLLIAVASGCASAGATPHPFPTPGARDEGRRASSPAHDIVATALSFRGVPYRPGGADPAGFDCSGLVSYVFAQHGHSVPRTVPEQYRLGQRIAGRSVSAGDLVFFRTTGRGPSHVGIAISADEFVHAPSSTGVVRVEPLTARYWSSRFLGARRLP